MNGRTSTSTKSAGSAGSAGFWLHTDTDTNSHTPTRTRPHTRPTTQRKFCYQKGLFYTFGKVRESTKCYWEGTTTHGEGQFCGHRGCYVLFGRSNGTPNCCWERIVTLTPSTPSLFRKKNQGLCGPLPLPWNCRAVTGANVREQNKKVTCY